MGNVLMDEYRKGDPAQNFQRWLQTSPDLIDKAIITQNKYFRTCSFTHRTRRIIMKVFFRRQLASVREYLKGFQIVQEMVEMFNCCHIMPLRIIDHKQAAKGSSTFIGACRQFTQTTLESRLTGRPRLNNQNKRWIIFQMILAVYTVHKDFNLYHGNVRTSNFLLTNYEQLILTDFGLYKPTYIQDELESGLAQFRLFYGSSINKCTLAPEKMAGNKNLSESERTPCKLLSIHTLVTLEKEEKQDNMRYSVVPTRPRANNVHAPKSQVMDFSAVEYNQIVKQLKAMDMFSLGCSILEVLNDGKPVFSYETLLSWKKNQFQIKGLIEKSTEQLPDGDKIKGILTDLIKIRPSSRTQIGPLLQSWLKIVNQDVYLLLWHVISAFSTTSFHLPDSRICLLHEIFSFIENEVKKTNYEFKMSLPHSLLDFHAMKIFIGVLKNKIIPTVQPGENHILKLIMSHVANSQVNEKQVESETEELMEDPDQRQEFFINNTNKLKSKRSSMANPMNISYNELCPPEWNESLMSLVESKYKGVKLTAEQELKNRFQDNLQRVKKHQGYRNQRIEEQRTYYEQFELVFKIIFSCIRGCKYVSSKLAAIQLMNLLGNESSDSCRLRTLMIYLISLTEDPDISVARYCFHSFLDLCYKFIDPFHSEDDTTYYTMILQTLVNMIKGTRLRSGVFARMRQVFCICEWFEMHCKRLVKNYKKVSFAVFIEAIKQAFPTFTPIETQLLMANLPDALVPQLFDQFICFISSEQLLGLQKSNQIAQNIDVELHKKMIGIVDSCVQSSLQESGIALKYAIQYFTIRKNTNKEIVKKVAPMIMHPHMWINRSALQYIHMCLREYPPTRVFFIFRQIFEPPFPLQEKDIGDDILLPKMLCESDIDLRNHRILEHSERKIGLTERLFEQYLKRMNVSKGYPVTSEESIAEWAYNAKPTRDIIVSTNISRLIEPTDFSVEIRGCIVQLYETNFLFYIGLMEKKFKHTDKEKEKEKNFADLEESCRKFYKFLLNDKTITYEKKTFFQALQTIINTNFEKLLKKHNRSYLNDKLKIANGIYIINSILQKFQQFEVRPELKLGSYYHRPTEFEKIPRPRGIQVSEIYEHKDIITCLQKIANTFFISGSNDGTLRVFNTKKIEMNIITDSEAYYEVKAQNSESAKISSIAAFEATYSIAVGTNKGQIKIYQVERLPGRSQLPKVNKNENNAQINKYIVGGEIEKVSTFNNSLKNQCFCYVTAEGNLGIQDVRMKTKTVIVSLGRERGIPRAMTVAKSDSAILVGTIDGYLLTYDVRCNIISSVLQLHNDGVPTGILNIQPAPLRQTENQQLYLISYPSKFYEFCYFNLQNDHDQFHAEKQFTSASPNEIVSVPYFVNKTNDENFKLCNNTLTHKVYYSTLSDFTRNFNILSYLGDPLTIRQNKIREVWMDSCKFRYNQICSLYNKKSLPFIQYLNSGLLTNLNPCISNQTHGNSFSERFSSLSVGPSRKSPLTLLVDPPKRQSRESYKDNPESIERSLVERPNNFKMMSFPDEESSQYFTCCKVLPNFVIVGCRNSVIKIYK